MNNFIIGTILIWGVAVIVWFIVTRVFQAKDVESIQSRLGGKEKTSRKDKTKGPALFESEEGAAGKLALGLIRRFELMSRIQTMLEQAGLRWKPAQLVHFCIGFFVAGGGLTMLFLPPQFRSFALVVACAFGTLPLLYVARARSKRLHRFEELFPESLEFVSRSMRAGHAFSVALEMIHREFQEPISGEFKRAFDEHNLGLPLEVALQKLAQRVPSLDVHFFVSAVLLQKRTGGNLAEILDKLAYVIRERFKLRGKIKAISAHGRMTGTALTSIPLGVAALMFWVNPDYASFFVKDEIGNYMVAAAVGLQILGYAIIQKIVTIEV
jgi:tight adherence protein B